MTKGSFLLVKGSCKTPVSARARPSSTRAGLRSEIFRRSENRGLFKPHANANSLATRASYTGTKALQERLLIPLGRRTPGITQGCSQPGYGSKPAQRARRCTETRLCAPAAARGEALGAADGFCGSQETLGFFFQENGSECRSARGAIAAGHGYPEQPPVPCSGLETQSGIHPKSQARLQKQWIKKILQPSGEQAEKIPMLNSHRSPETDTYPSPLLSSSPSCRTSRREPPAHRRCFSTPICPALAAVLVCLG